MARTALILGSRLAISSASSEERWRPTGGMSDASTGTGVSGLVAVVFEADVEAVCLTTTVVSFSDCRACPPRAEGEVASSEADVGERVVPAVAASANGLTRRAQVAAKSAKAPTRRSGRRRSPIVRGYRRPVQLGRASKCSSTSGATSRILHWAPIPGQLHPAQDQSAKRIFTAQRPVRAAAHVGLATQVGELPAGGRPRAARRLRWRSSKPTTHAPGPPGDLGL